MSTRALISVKQPDGTFLTIYNHSDGYPSWLGRMLLHHYNSDESANALVNMGDASFIDKNLWPDPQHPTHSQHRFMDAQDGVCVFYFRDRGEPWSDVKPVANVTQGEVIRDAQKGMDYAYIRMDGKWFVHDCCGVSPSNLQELTNEMVTDN